MGTNRKDGHGPSRRAAMMKRLDRAGAVRVPRGRCPAGGKPKYSKRAAQTAANLRRRESGREYRIYPCPRCGAWHMTSDV